MRLSAWVAALALLAVASCAVRPDQDEDISRQRRRLSISGAQSRNYASSSEATDVEHTSHRTRSFRRREELPSRQIRTRSKPETTKATELENTDDQTERNDRFSSRKTYNRTRNRTTTEPNSSKNDSSPNRIYRTRQMFRMAPTPATPEGPTQRLDLRQRHNFRKAPTPPTTTSPEITSLKIDESKIEVINSNLEDIPKMVFNDGANQFRRRSSASIVSTSEKINRTRSRNHRLDAENKNEADLASSGTTNNIVVSEKEQTTARNNGDLRNSRKLRYKTRLAESDTNLTGQGITIPKDQSSQTNDIITSQPELQTPKPIIVDSTESTNPSTTLKITKVTRRPLGRSKVTFRPPSKAKFKDEVSEDDNYPESFKALLQAKNVTSQTSSQSETLSVRESQKVYKTFAQTINSSSNDTHNPLLPISQFRKKQNEATTEKNGEETSTNKPLEKKLYKRPEYKARAVYSSRNKKPAATITTTTTEASNPEYSSTQKPIYKFNRKFKITTTDSPEKSRRAQNSELVKKSFYPRFRSDRNTTTPEISTLMDNASDSKDKNDIPAAKTLSREILPRTSYYSRLRSTKKESESSTENSVSSERKDEKIFEKPLIYTSVTSSGNENTVESEAVGVKKEPDDAFVISVTSKESFEGSTENGLNMDQSTEGIDMSQFVPTAAKYHSKYKNKKELALEDNKDENVTKNSQLKNIQPRQYSRRRKPEESKVITEANEEIGKFSDLNTKTASTVSNGITPEPEKTKGRFSSKYRSSYLDRPIYKATVPSVTPTTAWLKFFVTDRDLTKSVQGPIWFEGEPLFDVITESVPRMTVVETLPIIHEPSIELVEGEEIDLGPGMKAITITQTRRTLSSEDLRLSESVVKSSHVMNVEASQHSPSVTVSIFDALADILTSTPRPRLSTTTEVTPKTDIHIDVKQTLNGVSNNINVNSVRGLASDDSLLSTSSNIVTANTKLVQTTEQTTPISVINRMSVEELVTPSSNDKASDILVNIPLDTPIPVPTTPISARRPFAFKVLYSEPETDMTSTSSNQPSTVNPTTVHNTQSNLLLPNSKLVSSELTSMLTNNINDLLKSLDTNTRSRITVDMEKLLKSLIPRAVDGLTAASDDVDTGLNTTPYSLEDIRDTEFIMDSDKSNTLAPNLADTDTLQTVKFNSDVNTDNPTPSTTPKMAQSRDQNVKISDFLLDVTNIPVSDSNSQTTIPDITIASPDFITSTEETTVNTTPKINSTLSTDFLEDTVAVDSKSSTSNTSAANQDALPIPFFTNAKVSDFTLGEVGNINDLITDPPSTSTPSTTTVPENILSFTPNPSASGVNIVEPLNDNTVSPLQLWVLNKKAQVLKMIEDLIKQHNDELGMPPPLTDNQPNIISDRLSEIIENMNKTTASDVSNISDIISTFMTTTPITPNPTTPLSTIPTSSEFTILKDGITSRKTSDVTEMLEKNSFSLAPTNYDITSLRDTTTPVPSIASATTTGSTTTETLATTQVENDETTAMTNVDTTTQSVTEAITQMITEITTAMNIDTTESTATTNTVPSTTWVPPKKDYVIFGILPNDTVVRKDPNQDALESLTESSPYIVYGVLPNNTIIRKFPNGTRIPRVMQKVDVLPISPWSLRNPYSPIHNNPAIVRPKSNPIRVSTNVTSTDTTNNGTDRLTSDTVNNQQLMISSPILNLKDRSTMGITTTNSPPTEKSTASHVLSLRTSTMIPSVDVILLNSLSSAAKEEMVISSMTSSTSEPRILTLDIDPETKQIRTEKPANENMNAVFKFIPIDEIMTSPQDSNVLKLATKTSAGTTNSDMTETTSAVTELNSQTPQMQTSISAEVTEDPKSSVLVSIGTPLSPIKTESTTTPPTTTDVPTTLTESTITTNFITQAATTTTTTEIPSTTVKEAPTTQILTTTFPPLTATIPQTTTLGQDNMRKLQEDALLLQNLLGRSAQNINNVPFNSLISSQKQTTVPSRLNTSQNAEQLLQALLSATGQNPTTLRIPTTDINRQQETTTSFPSTTTRSIEEDLKQYEEDTKLLKALLQATGQNPAKFNIPSLNNIDTTPKATFTPTTTARPITTTRQPAPTTPSIQDDLKKFQEDAKLLQALLQATGQNPANFNIPTLNNIATTLRPATITARPITTTGIPTTTKPSLQDDLKKFQEDAKLLQALLQATGQNPANFNIPSLSNIITTPKATPAPTTTARPITTARNPVTNTPSVKDDLKNFQEDAKLLQALLQATGQNPSTLNIPVLAGVTSNVRKPPTSSNPTTMLPRPVYIPDTTTTMKPLMTTFQPRETTTNVRISTTNPPFTSMRRRIPTTTDMTTTRISNRNVNLSPRFAVTTEMPSSTFSPQEDLAFLNNLKNVLNTKNIEDPETALANRIIALAVEKSLNEIKATIEPERDSKAIANGNRNSIPTITERRTTTTTTTTTPEPTTTLSTPSIEEDIKQFEEDAKLLKALLKATGQNPANFNIPTLTTGVSNVRSSTMKPNPAVDKDLNLLANLLSSPSPLNEPFDPLTVKPLPRQPIKTTTVGPRPFGAKIAVKDDLRSVQDDKKLLQTLIKLQDAQESTTARNKITITGQSTDEALNKLLQKTKPTGNMVSEATQAPMSLSTEFGKSQDALLAALLKEQGFGPTTASSLDEQIRLAALLNQVVVTPKARRTTTPPPPPPPPRRPVLDGLAWLWQQWRETAPGPNAPRPSRRPSQAPASSSATSTSNRVNWFGSGPFVGNAEEKPTANRIPLEPPSAVTQPAPGRGQLVSAAINVTRAFSQFLGAAIQGAAQTVQSVIRAGQRAASDVYTSGSG